MLDKLPVLEDDGLEIREVGPWAEEKYRLVWNYAKMFTTSMKSKWDALVYIDLFSGSGYSKIEKTSKIVPASPLLALNIANKFDKYIFCDENKKNISSLQQRIKRSYTNVDISIVEADINKDIENVLSNITQHRAGFKVLSFCFVDPFKCGNLKFETIKKLSDKFIDFLILIPSYMDANRNLSYYLNPSNNIIEDFIYDSNWRSKWNIAEKESMKFGTFVADRFGQAMKMLNYTYNGLEDMVQVRSYDKNLPLYHLAFFSRNNLGVKFWQETRKYSNDQLDLLKD